MRIMTLDLETSIKWQMKITKTGKFVREETIHGSSSKDPNNDFFTIIYGQKEDDVRIRHSEKGFKRQLNNDSQTMLSESDLLITQNGKFDLGYIWENKVFYDFLIRGGKIWDIQLAHYLMSGQRHKFPSLAELQAWYLGVKTKRDGISRLFKKCIGADEIIKRRRNRRGWWKLYEYYAYQDGITPLQIYKKQKARADKLGMTPIIEMYNEYLLVLCMMEHNGIPLDMQKVEQVQQEFHLKMLKYLEKAENLVKEYWTDPKLPKLNINSREHTSAILFGGNFKAKIDVGKGEFVKTGPNKGKEKTKKVEIDVSVTGMGLNPGFFTEETKKKGVYKTGEEVIDKIIKHCKDEKIKEYCHNMQQAALYKKMISTYINAFIERSVNGKIACTYNNCQTITSRLSSSKPNLQNIPSKDADLKIAVQGCLIAPEGWTAVSIDYSQLEIYVKAALSQDKKLKQDIVDGIDFHVKRMCYAENIPYEEGYRLAIIEKVAEWVSKRKKAKTISFQKEYGAGVAKLAKSTGLPESVIQTILDKENEEYSGVLDWEINDVQQQIKQSTTPSYKTDLSKNDLKDGKNSRRFNNGVELIPIKNLDKKSFSYNREEIRYVGFYTSPTGKRYCFEEKASRTKRGDIFRYFPPTHIKNYMVQGTAGDCQAASSAEMFPFLLRNQDKVKLVNEIHDSKWFLVKNEYLSCIVPKLCSIMSNVREIFIKRFGWDPGIDFKVEAEIGKNFAEMQPFTLDEKLAA